MTSIEVFNPVAEIVPTHVDPAVRYDALEGKRVGLYWNFKTNGDLALSHVERLMAERFPGTTFVNVRGDGGLLAKHATESVASYVAQTCDVVVGAIADCGGCTSWLTHDLILFEKLGVPSVCIVAKEFEKDAARSAQGFGMPLLPLAVVPDPMSNNTHDGVLKMVDGVFDHIVRGLTRQVPNLVGEGIIEEHVTILPDEWLTFEGTDSYEALMEMNEQFLSFGWSDGFPLLAPTRLAMDRMAQATSRDLDETVGILEPGFGRVTVGTIAANAIMAGCRPEHLPVLIAAIECMIEPRMCVRGKQMSTGPDAPLLIINGPIADQLGINSGRSALGTGAPSAPNVVIGRALRLCLMNGGLAYPGVTDLDTIGTPAKFGMCVAENVTASPWDPFHVERGFAASNSTVSVQWTLGICELEDLHSTDPETLIRPWVTALTNAANLSTGVWMCGRRSDTRTGDEEREHHLLLIAPDHARIFKNAGWTKDRLRQELFDAAQMPFELMLIPKEPHLIRASHPELDWVWDAPDTKMPVVEGPDCYDFAVVGGAAGRSMLFLGSGQSITKAIEEPATHAASNTSEELAVSA